VAGDEAIGDRTLSLGPSPAEATFTFDLPRTPTGVAIDPDGHLLLTAIVRREP